MKRSPTFVAGVRSIVVLLGFTGCVRFHDQPLSAEKSIEAFNVRTLGDSGLKSYLESNRHADEWPLPVWDFAALTLAAFYFHPSLDVARAEWGVATAGKTTAGERPNPTLGVSPAYNTTTGIPSPWIVTPSLDIPIETAGKRGYRMAQASQLSEAARFNIASVAWKVRSTLRRGMVDLDAAQMRVGLLQEQQTVQNKNLRLLELQFQAGAIFAFEVTRARLSMDTTRLAAHDAERERTEARVRLARAVGVPSPALDGVEISFASLRVLPPDVASTEARRRALLNRTDIRGAVREYAASQSALQLEIAKQYPDVRLSPGYEFDQGDNKWSLGVSVTLPVLNHNQGAIGEAEARRARSAAWFNALQATVLAEVDLAVAGYDATLKKLGDADVMLGNLRHQETTARALLEAGEISKPDLLALQIQFSARALARLDAFTQARRAGGRLEDALQSPPAGLPSAELSSRAAFNVPTATVNPE